MNSRLLDMEYLASKVHSNMALLGNRTHPDNAGVHGSIEESYILEMPKIGMPAFRRS